MTKPRLLLVQPHMQPPGGGQCVSAWAAQALQADYALEVMTWTPLGVSEINRFYGTSLDPAKIKNLRAPAWLRAIVALDPDPWSYQRIAFMMRAAKWTRRRYDLIISCCDEMEFDAPALQYIHYPYLAKLYQTERALAARGHGSDLRLRLRPWRVISGFSFERMCHNPTLVNSNWTGRAFTAGYGTRTQTLYPPVTGNFPNVAWSERETGFVCIGRLSGEKRYEDIIAILGELRARGHNLHLHIIGALMSRRLNFNYYDFLTKLLEEHSEWVTLHENISRTELEQLVAQHRYGIHAMHDEHFGIAPAEMIRAGCIVFVFDEGGQVEIVGDEGRLRYSSIADAVDKIERVLNDEMAQQELRELLAARAKLFSPERFMSELRGHVTNCLSQGDRGT